MEALESKAGRCKSSPLHTSLTHAMLQHLTHPPVPFPTHSLPALVRTPPCPLEPLHRFCLPPRLYL